MSSEVLRTSVNEERDSLNDEGFTTTTSPLETSSSFSSSSTKLRTSSNVMLSSESSMSESCSTKEEGEELVGILEKATISVDEQEVNAKEQTESTTPCLLQTAIIERSDLLRHLLSFLDISPLTGLYIAIGRRCWQDFCQAISIIHTGYYSPCPPLVTNEEYFPQLFNPNRAFSKTVLNQLHEMVILARELPHHIPCYAPLSFRKAHQLYTAWCQAMDNEEVHMNSLTKLVTEYADDPNTELITKVNMSKYVQYHLRYRIIDNQAKYLRYFLMDSPYTSVAEGESALDIIRMTCPLLERLDLLFSFSMDDYQLFINPYTVWPSLKELDIGKLINGFCKKLEMNRYFDNTNTVNENDGMANGNNNHNNNNGFMEQDLDEDMDVDTDNIVYTSVISVLTREKFPKLETLEVAAVENDRMFAIFEAIVKCWVWGFTSNSASNSNRSTMGTMHSNRESFNSQAPMTTETSFSSASSAPGNIPNSRFGTFVGHQLKKLLIIHDPSGSNNGNRGSPFEEYHQFNLQQSWMNLFTTFPLSPLVPSTSSLSGTVNYGHNDYNAGGATGFGRNMRLSDPRLSQFCLFPHLQYVSFLPDLPSPYFMLLINSMVGQQQQPSHSVENESVGYSIEEEEHIGNQPFIGETEDATPSPCPFDLQVKGYHRVNLMNFLENFYQENRWSIRSLDCCAIRSNCSTDFRRNHLGSRRRYTQFREMYVAPSSEEDDEKADGVIQQRVFVPHDCSDREYMMNIYWNDYFEYQEEEETGDGDEDNSNGLGRRVDTDYHLQQSSKSLFQAMFVWNKLQHLQGLTLQLTTLMAMIDQLEDHHRNISSSELGVFQVALPHLQSLEVAFNVVSIGQREKKCLNRFVRILTASLTKSSCCADSDISSSQSRSNNYWSLSLLQWRVFTGQCWLFVCDSSQNGFPSLSSMKDLKHVLDQRRCDHSCKESIKVFAQYDTEKIGYM